MKKVRIVNVVGARPNFMKMAPVLRELSKYKQFEPRLVHTGQHYDECMSQVFFRDLNMPSPDFNLGVGSGSHAVQTAECMRRFEDVCCSIKPDLVIVAGDVNSTLACSLTAAKLHISIAHIESGLRSFDRTMPEEINRIVTDSVADMLFTTEESGNRNLRREGVSEDKIHFVGNTMIDSLVHCLKLLDVSPACGPLADAKTTSYFLATIHRPSNVDDPVQLLKVLEILESASRLAPLFLVSHPRTRERLEGVDRRGKLIEFDGGQIESLQAGCIYTLPPLPYLDFLQLMANSKAVLTDSGGVQEETTFLGIPCLTLRNNTERPSTVELGTNQIVGVDSDGVLSSLCAVRHDSRAASIPPLWDGRAAQRIITVLRNAYELA